MIAVYYSSLSCFVVSAIRFVNVVVTEEKGSQIEQLVVIIEVMVQVVLKN